MVNVEAKTEELLAVIAEADRAVMSVYSSQDLGTELKADKSPITKADIASHQILMAGINQLFPDIPVVSEEGDLEENRQIVLSERFWLVDPLDGTREFIAKTGHFSICAALIEDDKPILGIISAPALGATYYGLVGHGAYQKDSRSGVVQNMNPSHHVPPIVVGSLSNLNSRTAAYIDEHFHNSPILKVGSQIKFARIAEGLADVYPRLGDPLHLWDIAAGDAIVCAAGGSMARFDGSKVNYHSQDLMAGDFIAQNR